jgi:3-oxoacyl-[acyl-carrier-protein] synthase I
MTVYVTGYAALSAGGHDVDSHWSALMAKQTKIAQCKEYDLKQWSNQLAGEIQDFNWQRALPDRKLMKVISRQDIMGLYAAFQAADHAGLTPFLKDAIENNTELCDRTGVFVGSPGNKYFQQYDFLSLVSRSKGNMQYFAQNLFESVHPMWLLRILPNNVLAYTGIQLACKGVNHNITNHAVGGMQALIEAYWAIKTGQADRIIVIAYDIGTEPQARFYYEQLGVLSEKGIAAFAKEHDGTVLAEGAAAIVLESQESVDARGIKPLAKLCGGQFRTEGAGLFSLQDSGEPLAELIQSALKSQDLQTSDLHFVVAHGNGNQKSDISEAKAIAAVFGPNAIPVTAHKWLMGHTLCASGLLDVVLTAKALQEKTIPPLIHSDLSHSCQGIDLVTQAQAIQAKKARALIINRGFASMNAVAILEACDAS